MADTYLRGVYLAPQYWRCLNGFIDNKDKADEGTSAAHFTVVLTNLLQLLIISVNITNGINDILSLIF